MPSRRGIGFLAAAAGAWLASRILGASELAMAAGATLVLVGLAVVYTRVASAALVLRRSVNPHRLFFDAEGSVELMVTNVGRLATAVLQVEDAAPEVLAPSPRFVVSPIPGQGAVHLNYGLHAVQRGRFTLGPVDVRLRDPFGLASRREQLGDQEEVVVYPPVWRLPPGLPLGGRRIGTGDGRSRPSPIGDDLSGVRQYVRGDDLRRVHWRTTARRGELMIRQDESPQSPSGVVVLDAQAAVHRGAGPSSSFEIAVAAASSVTYHLAERGHVTRLLVDADDIFGRAQPWEVVLERLAVIQPHHGIDLGALWRDLSNRGAGAGALVAVVTTPSPELLRAMVRAGRSFGTRAALLVDASFRGQRADGAEPVAEALRTAGWRVSVLGPDDRLDNRWAELAVQRPTRDRAVV